MTFLSQLLQRWHALPHTVVITPPSDDAVLRSCVHQLWLGHALWTAGDQHAAVLAYARAGIIGAPSLACAFLHALDIGAAVSLALRVSEICFAEGFQLLKVYVLRGP